MQYSSSDTAFLFTITRVILLLLYGSIILVMKVEPSIGFKLPPNASVPAIFGFGDSIIDPGNNNNLLTIVKCNFPPYGKDFLGGIPSGRFSNGRIPTDLIAEILSIKRYVPAYFDNANLPLEELVTGVSFASGACGYDPLTSKMASAIPLSKQLDEFVKYKERMKNLIGEERLNFILDNSIFYVVAGSDDIANTYFDSPFRKKLYDVDSYTDLMLNSASSFIQELYKVGARRIGVFGTPPLGCMPSQRTLAGGIFRECAEEYNQASQLFNSKLIAQIDSLNRALPNAKIIYTDIYYSLLDLIQNPHNFGLEQVVKGCCGTGKLEVSVLCNKVSPVCADDSKYLFWDSYHPTERGYQLLLQKLTPGFYKFFEA